jgi:predicted dehydrogenase
MYGVGIIGLDHPHGKTFAETIANMQNVEFIGLSDTVEDRGRQVAEKYKVPYYSNYHDLLARKDVDIVCIFVETYRHKPVILDCARVKKHIITEKPLETTKEKAKAIIDACKATNVKLIMKLYDREGIYAKKAKVIIEEGRIGNIHLMNAVGIGYACEMLQKPPFTWFGSKEKMGGGILIDFGAHQLDLLLFLGGKVEYVTGSTSSILGLDTEDTAIVTLKFVNGALANIVTSRVVRPDESGLTVYGSKGILYLQTYRGPLAMWTPEEGLKTIDIGTSVSQAKAYEGIVLDLINAIEHDSSPPMFEESLESLEVALATYKSAKTGKRIFLSKNEHLKG